MVISFIHDVCIFMTYVMAVRWGVFLERSSLRAGSFLMAEFHDEPYNCPYADAPAPSYTEAPVPTPPYVEAPVHVPSYVDALRECPNLNMHGQAIADAALTMAAGNLELACEIIHDPTNWLS